MDEVGRLVECIERLTAEVERLTARVLELERENLYLKEENHKLKARLGMDSSNSSKPPSSNPPWIKPAPKKKTSGKKPGGQPKHKGVARTPVPPEGVDHQIPVFLSVWKNCNVAMEGNEASRIKL